MPGAGGTFPSAGLGQLGPARVLRDEQPVGGEVIGQPDARQELSVVIPHLSRRLGIGVGRVDDHQAGSQVDDNQPRIVGPIDQPGRHPQVEPVSPPGLFEPGSGDLQLFEGFGVGTQRGNHPVGGPPVHNPRPLQSFCGVIRSGLHQAPDAPRLTHHQSNFAHFGTM